VTTGCKKSRQIYQFVGLVLTMLMLGGCATRPLMPAPNLYSGEGAPALFGDLPAELQGSRLDLLYVTDRSPETDDQGKLAYGFGRSRSVAFGSAIVAIEPELAWEELQRVSLETKRTTKLTPRLASVEEQGRFPEMPLPLVLADGEVQPEASALKEVQQVEQDFRAQILRRLALAPKPEVVLFVHGYNNDFEDAALTLAELWHFLGREQVPILYTWPAGRGGPSGYIYDRESGEFTVYHLKNLLRSLANMTEIEKFHLIAHSRGTDVLSTAVRELMLETRNTGENAREKFRVAHLVLAAPDMDFEVVEQRIISELLYQKVQEVIVYTSQEDKAISIAEEFFKSIARLGRLAVEDLDADEIASLEYVQSISIIELQEKSDRTGHGYFHNSPEASSDLIMAVRYGLGPGAEFGRPLKPIAPAFWIMEPGYPKAPDTEK
jgi:esterase/lipase superfamily enzyme